MANISNDPYEQLSVESNQVKRRWKCTEWKLHSRPSHLQKYMELCSPWKTKLWQNSNDPYPVVVLNMCLYPQEYATPLHLPSRYPSWKWGSSDSVHAGSLFLGKYLYSDTASATHLHASGRLAVQKLVEIESGDEEQNCQINITTNFPCYLSGIL